MPLWTFFKERNLLKTQVFVEKENMINGNSLMVLS